jgi:colanic acid/amylovoran biosynthesis glycosyltransferase
VSTLRVAYLVSLYPALSHAFIDREIAALRARGVEVVPFSVRHPGPADVLAAADRAAAAATPVLKSRQVRPWAIAHLALARHSPAAYVRGLLRSQTYGARGARARLWQLFYWAEAVVLLGHLQRRGLRHVHVHFANNAADIARQTAALGRDAFGGSWTWSMAMHGPTEFVDPVGYDLAAKATDAAFVACITDWCRAQILALAPTARTTVVAMGTDLTRYARQQRERPAGARLRVLFVGRLVAEKGPADLIATLAGAPDLELVLAGDGPLRGELTAAAAAAPPGAVRLLGPVSQEELPGWYAWADVFVLPSYDEGLPVVLMEALATGLPVLTTPVAGIPELVVDEVTGLLVAPGDRAAIAAAVARLRDPALRDRLGAAGRVVVETRHDAAAAVEPLLVALRDAFGAVEAGPAPRRAAVAR